MDIDFDSERRDEALRYLMERYPGRTAMVATVQTLRVRMAVRLAARALGFPPAELRRLTSCLPWSLGRTPLSQALERLPELKKSPLRREGRLVEAAEYLARLPFQVSVHLGGLLITPGDLFEFTPAALSPRGWPVAHLDKDDVDRLGLLKLDLLGLRMHTALRLAGRALAEEGAPLDLDRLPPGDPATYELLGRTETVGVFQVESPGQRALLGRLQPRNFDDLTAEISLFRPGPVEGNVVDPFIRRRDGLEEVVYAHPDLAPILAETHGLILYQEQVLRIVHVFAGLSYEEADQFRRTMTRDREPGRMEQLRCRFLDGAEARGRGRELAETVWTQVLVLAAYGFCKAHAASFAHLTYQSAYLKANHPRAFFLGLLNAGRVGSYPPGVLLNEARRCHVPVFGPHVNQSRPGYSAEGRGIRAGLMVIRGLGPALARKIVREREARGLFLTRDNFAARVPLPGRLPDVLERAGALDGLAERTPDLFEAAGVNPS